MNSESALRRLLRRLYHLYYRVKYFPFHAERRRRREDTRRGFIAIQIDALAHDDLLHAVELGYVPTLRRLIDRYGWDLRKYPAGLPSATPAAQAAIFFGTKDRLPAFRWYEKETGRVLIGSKQADVQTMRDRLPRDGILRGGSSYVNLYDGGADRAIFTVAARTSQKFLQKMGGRRVALLLATHPLRTLWIVIESGIEYVREEWERLKSQVRGEYTYYWWYLPFLHICTNVILRELQTLAVLLDIYTGSPAIYTTYNVYDEFAHHFGPGSRASLSSLADLDRRIGEIMRMLRRLPGRPYDIYILSDHGQTPSRPYRIEFGETLGDSIVGAAKHGVLVMAGTGDYAPAHEDVMNFLIEEIEHVSTESRLPTPNLGMRIGRWIRRQYKIFPLLPETAKADGEIVVTYSSSLAHVYWSRPKVPLTFDEIRADPDRRALYYFLVAHKGIGVVITRMLDGAHVETLHGRCVVMPDGQMEVLEGEDPLRDYAKTAVERKAIAHIATLPNAGDMVLFGAYDPKSDRCICFDDQVGAHGAMGGRQFWPFLLTPPGLVDPNVKLEDPLDLHPIFRRYTSGRRQPD
ncbi:MAG TPA: alkaline phosphatase family protein [Longimicrobiales bacterium]